MRIATFAALVTALAVGAIAPLGTSADAAGQRARTSAAAALGMADLCLSSDARWLRHPSLSEPGAAFADLPGGLDAYPAGMVLAPPAALYAGSRGTVVHLRTR